jgi:hypothetical protein
VIPIIPLINKAFFRDKLIIIEIKVKEGITLVIILLYVRFRVS